MFHANVINYNKEMFNLLGFPKSPMRITINLVPRIANGCMWRFYYMHVQVTVKCGAENLIQATGTNE
jgi:hypothetical protein